MTRIRAWFVRLPNWLRAGIVTGTFTALPGFMAATLDVVNDFASWAAGETVQLPDLAAWRAAAVSVVAGAITGGLNAAYRLWQERTNRGTPPVYPPRTA